jgi:hypothetical protein
MAETCDLCGFSNSKGSHFCGGCGVDLREPKNEELKKSSESPQIKENKSKKKEIVFKWCSLRQSEFPYVLVAFAFLFKGEATLGFCDCSICNQGYREYSAFILNHTENRKLKATSREIVKKVLGEDITKYKFNLEKLMVGLENPA